jgi:DGQHR domain-containing protein
MCEPLYFAHHKTSASEEALAERRSEMGPQTPALDAIRPKGALTFKAIRVSDSGRVSYIGAMPVYDLLDKHFVAPVASEGLAPEILDLVATNGPVQRKTNPAHVQGIVDYIIEQAEKDEPWAFNAIVLYSTTPLAFEGVSIGMGSAGEARTTEAFSVGEGLHRSLAWGVTLDLAKVRGVRRPEMSEQARRRIEQATIPVIVVEEQDLRRQKAEFNALNQQKPLTASVLTLTDTSELSQLTRQLIHDVPLFKDRIDLNNASVGARSDKLLSFSQLRFVVASFLLGRKTRRAKDIEKAVSQLLAERGVKATRQELREVFTEIATRFGGLERLHRGRILPGEIGDFVRTLRRETLLASNAAWRALAVALHDAKEAGIDPVTAIERVKHDQAITWTRDAEFFRGTLLEVDPETGHPTGRLLSGRESIDSAAGKLLTTMVAGDAEPKRRS